MTLYLEANFLRRFELNHSLTFPRVGLTAFGTTRSGVSFPSRTCNAE